MKNLKTYQEEINLVIKNTGLAVYKENKLTLSEELINKLSDEELQQIDSNIRKNSSRIGQIFVETMVDSFNLNNKDNQKNIMISFLVGTLLGALFL